MDFKHGSETQYLDAEIGVLDDLSGNLASAPFGGLLAQLYVSAPVWQRGSVNNAKAKFAYWRNQKYKWDLETEREPECINNPALKGYLPEPSFSLHAKETRDNLDFIRMQLKLCAISDSDCTK